MPSFDEARKLYPGWKDADIIDSIAKENGVDPAFVRGYFGYKEPTLAGEFKKGVSRGLDQLQGLGYGAVGLAGDLTGFDSVRDWGLEGYMSNMEQAAQNPAAVASYVDVNDVDSALQYLSGGLGEVTPQIAASLGSGGLGALLARSAARRAIASRGLEGLAAKQLLGRATAAGATAGGTAYGMGVEPASIYGDIYAETGEYAPGTALAYGLPAGALEGLSERFLFKGLSGGLPAGASRLRNAAKQAGVQAITGGVAEELPQTALEQAALNSIDPAKGFDSEELINATILGALGQGVPGGVAGAMTPRQRSMEINPPSERTDLLAHQAPEGQADLGLGFTGEEALGLRGLRNPYDTAGVVSQLERGQVTRLDDPQADLFDPAVQAQLVSQQPPAPINSQFDVAEVSDEALPAVQTPAAPRGAGDQFIQLGGRDYSLRNTLNAATTPESALEAIRAKAETTASSRTIEALDKLHLDLTGQTLEAWRVAQEAANAVPTQMAGTNQQAALPPGVPAAQDPTAAQVPQGGELEVSSAVENERKVASDIFDSLTERQQRILSMYHFDKLTFDAIGEQLNPEKPVTRSAVQQQHKRALEALLRAGKKYGLTEERLRTYFPDESTPLAAGADVETASVAEVAQMGGMHYRDEPGAAATAPEGVEAGPMGGELSFVDDKTGQFDEGFRKEAGVAEEGDAGEIEVASFATERDHAGNLIRDVDIQEAGEDYDSHLEDGDIPFGKLPRAEQVRYTKAWIALYDEVITDQQLTRIQNEIADAATPETNRESFTGEAGPLAGVPATVHGGDAREASGQQGDRQGQGNPLEARVAALRPQLGERQNARLDKLIARFQEGDFDVQRFADELQLLEEQAFAPEQGGKGMQFSVGETAYDRLVGEVERWKSVVADYLSRTIDSTRTHLLLSKTPASMQALGLPDLEVRVGMHALGYADMRLTREQLEDLPRQLANPQMAYIHRGANDDLSINFVTEYGNASGAVVVALRPNQHVREPKNAHFVVTILNVPPHKLAAEARAGHALYVADQDRYPGLREALEFGKRKNGREASEVRANLARSYGITSVPKRVLYQSDLRNIIVGGGALYSSGEQRSGVTSASGPSGLKAPAAVATLRKLFFSPARFDNLVKVFQSDADAIAAGLLFEGEYGVQGFTLDGKVYLIADNIQPGEELAVFLHEVGVHLGMERLIGESNFKALVGQISQWATLNDGSQESTLARAAFRRIKGAEKAFGELTQVNLQQEVVAYFVEEAVKAGVDPTGVNHAKGGAKLAQWFRTMWAAVKVALRRLGLGRLDHLTPQNIVDLAYGAARMELAGTYHGTAADFRKFDHDYMGSGEGAQAFGWGTYLAQRPGIAKGYWQQDVARKGNPDGSLMRVDIAVSDDEILDWDRPLSEQSEAVKSLLASAGIEPKGSWDPDGGDLYRTLEGDYDRLSEAGFEVSDKGASEYLDSLGIKGIKFLDARSRSGGQTQTRNIVVFNDANILRVTTHRGARADDVKFSVADNPKVQAFQTRTHNVLASAIRHGLSGLAFTHDVVQAAVKAGIPAARNLEMALREKINRANEIEIDVERVLSLYASLPQGQQAQVEKAVYDMTRSGKWGFEPDWRSDVEVDAASAEQFNALQKSVRDVVIEVFRHGDTIFHKKLQLLRDTIGAEYSALIANTESAEERAELQKKQDDELRQVGHMLNEWRGPYAPLRRFGNYVVVAKSQKFRDQEADGKSTTKLRSDGKHYVVEFALSAADAVERANALKQEFGDEGVWFGEKEEAGEHMPELPFVAVQRLRQMIGSDMRDETGAKAQSALDKMLVDLYITTLHETNARHAEQRRHNVAGASKEMMRAFATQGRADAYLVSSMEFSDKVIGALTDVRAQAKQPGGDTLAKTRLRNELLQRYMMGLDYKNTPVVDKLLAGTSFWMLLTSPAYYVQNATQVFMMTQPVLAAKFGQGRSWRRLMAAARETVEVLGKSSWNESANLDSFRGTSMEKDLLATLQRRGTLDFGISAELGYWEATGTASKVLSKVMRKFSMGVRKVEVMNRMTSALAAYRLAFEGATGTEAERHAKAVDYADSIVVETHGDYSSQNAPRYLRMLPRVLTQFRKFQLIQLSLFAKHIKQAFAKAPSEERAVARAALTYLLANHALLAGGLGLPAANLVAALWGAVAGDDDDPADLEVDLRRGIGDKAVADLLLYGAPALLGLNLSQRIGAGQMLDPLPFVEFEASRGGYEKAVTAAMGPLVGGVGAQAVDAIGRISKGEIIQGTAQLLPRGLRDAIRGAHAASEGVLLRDGTQALTPDELSLYDTLMMGLGLPTSTTTYRQNVQRKATQYEKFYRERTTDLKREYVEAYEAGEGRRLGELHREWLELQQARRANGFKAQPLSDLRKAPKDKAKREKKLEGGVRTTEQARGFVQSLR